MIRNYTCPPALESLAQADLGLQQKSWLEQAIETPGPNESANRARVVVAGNAQAIEQQIDALSLPAWQAEHEKKTDAGVSIFSEHNGPVILVRCPEKNADPQGMLQLDSDYAQARDVMGEVVARLKKLAPDVVSMDFQACSRDQVIGCLAGMEISTYNYRSNRGDAEDSEFLPTLEAGVEQSWINEAIATGQAVNTARHLVNLPAADLHPGSYSELLGNLFRGSAATHVTVWNSEKLQEERMGLMLAVGAAAEHGPCLVHIRYRHPDCDDAPIALVGKGITFDTGGLDLKPSAFMRYMKKDMGGSAALAGLAVWLDRVRPAVAVDIYLAIAENSVGQKAFRPGDILTARNGKTVEIDNTDAEGRLVLADALSLAVSQEGPDKPEQLIDVATLTGAARVALGLKVGVMFATDDNLAGQLIDAGNDAGDPLWRLPMVKAYSGELKSSVAALVNSSTSRFGGAITAAMFLAEFVGTVPWAHIDVNAWNESSDGAVSGPGGNGQTVQCLIEYLRSRVG